MGNCIRVPKKDGEHVRTKLMNENLLDTGRKIGSEGDFLLIPIISGSYEGYEMVDAELESLESTPTDYKEVAEIPQELKEDLPTSYDIIGDVAIIKLTDELLPYRSEIGRALMSVTPSLRTVFMDSGVKGDLRIRELEQIAGTGGSETIHKEFGVRMAVDPAKVYFNPRLATERSRVASLVKDGEVIIDLFAGVAPFGLIICKLSYPSMVYSIDLNPDAGSYAMRNKELNHIYNIVPLTGDSSVVIKELPYADRIIMNLPQMADTFLDAALSRTKVGGTVHMHRIMERSEMEPFIEEIKERMRSSGYGVCIDKVSELKTYSPTMSVYVLDIIRES